MPDKDPEQLLYEAIHCLNLEVDGSIVQEIRTRAKTAMSAAYSAGKRDARHNLKTNINALFEQGV